MHSKKKKRIKLVKQNQLTCSIHHVRPESKTSRFSSYRIQDKTACKKKRIIELQLLLHVCEKNKLCVKLKEKKSVFSEVVNATSGDTSFVQLGKPHYNINIDKSSVACNDNS